MADEGVTLITGASGGLGTDVVRHLITKGHRNIACQYFGNKEEISSILQSNDLNENHLYQCDLTNEDQVAALRQSIEEKLGRVTNLVNLTGGSSNGMCWKLSLQDFKKVLDMNLTTTFLTCREFIPSMRENGYGRIVNTSSVVGFTGVAGASHYCAAKAAITGFSKALSLELANKNITVNTLGLGYFNRGLIDDVPEKIQAAIIEQVPLRKLGEAGDIGGLLLYLFSKEASFVTGQVFHMNGGLH